MNLNFTELLTILQIITITVKLVIQDSIIFTESDLCSTDLLVESIYVYGQRLACA